MNTGHADGIQSQTLEIFDSFGFADTILEMAVVQKEMCHWVGVSDPNKKSRKVKEVLSSQIKFRQVAESQDQGVQRKQKTKSDCSDISRFPQVLLNQGYVEQAFLDHLQQKGRIVVERNTRAKHLKIDNEGLVRTDAFPLTVDIRKLRQDRSEESTEVVRAKYLIGCDGAHSWTRKEMGVTMHEHSTDSVWGVMDIEPVTDFHMLFLFWSGRFD